MCYDMVKSRKDERVVTVGGLNADINGLDSRAIQMAVDLLKTRSEGTVKINKGVFEITAPIRLYDNITLIGAGKDTILRKTNGFKTSFIVDADYGELKATVKDASGFTTGMGIQLYDSDKCNGWSVSTAVITAVENNTIYFDNYLIMDYRSDKDGVISNACSIIEGVETQNIKVSDLVIHGNKETNEYLNGCRGGAIYLHKSKNCTVENVKVFDFNGDGISWQITEDITVKNCEIAGCTNFGLHPGTGSIRTVVEECDIHDNGTDGIFVCWRVQHGLFRSNRIHNNGKSGINIGHKDSDNLFELNDVFMNVFSGIYLRPETITNGAHRNIYKGNKIENNGSEEKGYGVFIDSKVYGNVIEGNIIRDTGVKLQKVGILVNCSIPDLKIVNNEMSGHTEGDVIL